MMNWDFETCRVPDELRDSLAVQFVAKHALASGDFDKADGTHALYHHEIRDILQGIFQNVSVANDYECLFRGDKIDYLFTLLNRMSFRNSEVMAPVLAEYRRISYLGATPAIRALCDDKNIAKMFFQNHRILTPQWTYVLDSATDIPEPEFKADGFVAKPNNSSASWGIKICGTWVEAKAHAEDLIAKGNDVLIEEYIPGRNFSIPMIGGPKVQLLPPVEEWSGQEGNAVSYEQKRGFEEGYSSVIIDDLRDIPNIISRTRALAAALGDFDYGRVDYRLDDRTGELYCLEINLSCNLGSHRAIGKGAKHIGVSHADLVETIVAHSIARQHGRERVTY